VGDRWHAKADPYDEIKPIKKQSLMKKRSLSICGLTLLAILALSPALAQGQEIRQAASEIPGAQTINEQSTKLPVKILQFLKGSEMQKDRATFTGQIEPIPENLKQLLMTLYLHRFTIVRMKISRDISYATSELIVVSDAKTGDVVSYLWQAGMTCRNHSNNC